MKIRIGTRGSDLALAQSNGAADRLRRLGHEAELEIIKTSGDTKRDVEFAQVGAPGVFVRELETALVEKRVDLAVHSFKDLPSACPEELIVAAVPEREDPTDSLLVKPESADPNMGLLPVKKGGVVGTASARRIALLKHLRPDLEVKFLRGNVPTRVRKLHEEDYDAILLATAGLKRLEVYLGRDLKEGLTVVDLDPSLFVPAPTQGALAYQVRKDHAELLEVMAALDSSRWRPIVTAERKLLSLVEGGCQLPFGGWCRALSGGELELIAVLEDHGVLREVRAQGADPVALAEEVWTRLRPQGSTDR